MTFVNQLNKDQIKAFTIAQTKMQKALVLGLANLGGQSIFGPVTVMRVNGDRTSLNKSTSLCNFIRWLVECRIDFKILVGPRGGICNSRLSFNPNQWTKDKLCHASWILGKRQGMRIPQYAGNKYLITRPNNEMPIAQMLKNDFFSFGERERFVLSKLDRPKSRQEWLDSAGMTEHDLIQFGL